MKTRLFSIHFPLVRSQAVQTSPVEKRIPLLIRTVHSDSVYPAR